MDNELSALEIRKYVLANFKEGTTHKIQFHSKKNLFLKIESLDGRKLYSFSENFHNSLFNGLKLELEPDEEYYIYDEDKYKFSLMDAEEQLEYLNKVNLDGTVIGRIKSKEIQAILKKYIQTEKDYTIEITDSKLTHTPWWHIQEEVEDGITVSIWANKIIDGDIQVTIDNAIKSARKRTFETDIEDLVETFGVHSNCTIRDSSVTGFVYAREILSYVIDKNNDRKSTAIFTIAYNYTKNKKDIKARIIMRPSITEDIEKETGMTIDVNSAGFYNIHDITDMLNDIGEVLRGSKKYRIIGEAIGDCLGSTITA